MDRIKILYIAGFGRSGSTLLDIILGNHPQIFGAGELRWLFHYLSCTFRDVTEPNPDLARPPWDAIVATARSHIADFDARGLAELSDRVETGGGTDADVVRHREAWGAVYRAIAEHTGCRVIVDSSKSARNVHARLPCLFQHPDLDVRALHILRDPHAVAWSIRRNLHKRQPGIGLLQEASRTKLSMLHWLSTNRRVNRLPRQHPGLPLHRVYYHRLVTNTRATLEGIGAFADIDMEPVLERLDRGEAFEPPQIFGGNRIKDQGPLRLKLDEEWREHLPGYARMLVGSFTPFLRSFDFSS